MKRQKQNILNSLDFYEAQLRTSLSRLQENQESVNNVYAQLPEEERMLRAIERQQNLKENLFLVLLQKREEAAINLAVTAPSVKVIDYALSSGPTAPKKVYIYGFSAFAGLFLPFGILFLFFTFDNKISEIVKTWKKPCPTSPLPGKSLIFPKIHESMRKDQK